MFQYARSARPVGAVLWALFWAMLRTVFYGDRQTRGAVAARRPGCGASAGWSV